MNVKNIQKKIERRLHDEKILLTGPCFGNDNIKNKFLELLNCSVITAKV